MQTFKTSNLLKYQNGDQTDVAIADGGEATSASLFLSLTDFLVQNAPEPLRLGDAQGNRTTHSHNVVAERSYPFSGGGTLEVSKIGTLLYYTMGEVTSAQDGATGAYEHTFTASNNVILPKFTLFYNVDGEANGLVTGYKRLKNCQINSLSISVSDTEATFTFEGFATGEDNTENSTVLVEPTTLTTIAYQSNGLIRYTFSSTDLSGVSNGDVLNTTGVTGIVESSNEGKFIIVNVNDASDYVDVINPNRSDNTDDETGLTATGTDIIVVTTPNYADPVGVLLRRHSSVKDVVIGGDLDAATANGMSGFNFTYTNNSKEIRESAESPDPSLISAGLITTEATFTQVLNTERGAKAIQYREGEGEVREWRIGLEDSNIALGTSTTHKPMLNIDVESLSIPTRANMHGEDLVSYDWVLYTSDEQGTSIKLRNETASYGA